MSDTMLSLDDVVELLNNGGWQLTGGAAKRQVTSVNAQPLVYAARIAKAQAASLDLHCYVPAKRQYSQGAVGNIESCLHPDGDPSAINIYGMRHILQTYPGQEGGGTYTVPREICELTFRNPAIAARYERERVRIDVVGRAEQRELMSQNFTRGFEGLKVEAIDILQAGRIRLRFDNGELMIDASHMVELTNTTLAWRLNGREVPLN